MNGKIVKGIAGFYYVHVVESVFMNVKRKEYSEKTRLNRWLVIMLNWKFWIKKKNWEISFGSCHVRMN